LNPTGHGWDGRRVATDAPILQQSMTGPGGDRIATYVVRRTLQVVPTLLLVTVLVFGLLQVTGGDPIAIMMGPSATSELIAQVRHELELDQPAYIRSPRWLGRVVQGDLGKSIRTRRPVADMILARAPTTLTLAASATVFSVVVGMASGIYAAVRRGRPDSYVVGAVAVVGASIPNYFLALVLMVILGVELRLVPIAAFSVDVLREPETLANLIMPTIALGATFTALLSRITRASMLEVLEQDYVRTARAKGLGEWVVTGRHALGNAMLPVITQIAINGVYRAEHVGARGPAAVAVGHVGQDPRVGAQELPGGVADPGVADERPKVDRRIDLVNALHDVVLHVGAAEPQHAGRPEAPACRVEQVHVQRVAYQRDVPSPPVPVARHRDGPDAVVVRPDVVGIGAHAHGDEVSLRQDLPQDAVLCPAAPAIHGDRARHERSHA
jgi:peptide/nickel transport system permease protein